MGEDRGCQVVERGGALHVAEQHDVPGGAGEGGESAGHEVPAAMDVAHEHDAELVWHAAAWPPVAD